MYAGKKKEMTKQEFIKLMRNMFESSEKEANQVFSEKEKDKTCISFGKPKTNL